MFYTTATSDVRAYIREWEGGGAGRRWRGEKRAGRGERRKGGQREEMARAKYRNQIMQSRMQGRLGN
jgi:hypothetical protein